MNARHTLRLGVLAIVAFAAGLVAARFLLGSRAVAVPETENATVFTTPREITSLDLVDETGRPFTAQSLQGQWSYVFFGFTLCPDICPTTLALLKQVRTELGDLPVGHRPRVLLFTVDPERDTPEKLREYVRFFDPSFGGVTGSPAAVQAAAAAFAVPFARVTLPQGGYTMDHGAGLFLVSPEGSVIAYSSPPFQAATLARDYRRIQAYFAETRE